MLNEWSDRENENVPMSRRSKAGIWAVGLVVAIGTAAFLLELIVRLS